MNENDLKNTVNHIRLPEESKERIIRNLENIHPEEYVFDVEPAKTPIFRYAMTAIAACAVLAVSTAGLYNLTKQRNFSPASEVNPGEVITAEQMRENSPDIFRNLADVSLYAVMGVDKENAPASVTYMTLRDDQKQKLAELYSSLDLQTTEGYSYICDETDTFRLFFQYQEIYYSILTAKGSPAPPDGIKWDEKTGYVRLTCWTGASEGSTVTFQADASVIDEMMNLIADSTMSHTVPVKYELYSPVYNPTPLMDLMFCETVHTDMINLIAEMQNASHEAYFMTMNPDETYNDARRSGEYFGMSYEQQKEFANLLMNQNNPANIHAQYSVGGKIPATVYLDNGTVFEFWGDSILIENPPSFPDDSFQLTVDKSVIEQIHALLESFKADSECHVTNHTRNPELLEQMFSETQTAPFGDISQMETRFMFTAYAPAVILPTEEQKTQIADLLNSFDYANRVNRNFDYGQYYSMYINSNDEWKQIKFLLEGYISWEEDDKAYIYEAPELVSAVQDLLNPVTVVYEEDENGTLYPVYLDDYEEYDLSEYLEILEEYNQAHPNYQLQISDDVLNGEPYAVKQFVSRTPEEYRQLLNELYEKGMQERPGYQLENKAILIHHESFSPNEDGTFSLDYDETYNLTQKQKQQLADLLNNEAFDYIITGWHEIPHDEAYSKSVVEFTEENSWLTVEYDSEEDQYYLIWCQEMEGPGEPVETGTYAFYKVEPRFVADFANAVNPEDGLEIHYPVNENGQTYGAVGMLAPGEAYPDLISVIGDNGIQGYCLKSDMNEIDALYTPESPDKIVEWKASIPETPPTLNVYAKDGKTIIDTFTYGSR